MPTQRVRFAALPLALILAVIACALPNRPPAAPTASPTLAAAGLTTPLPTLAATAPATPALTPAPTVGRTAVPPTPATAAGGCANAYFPLNTHSTWTYASTNILGDSSFIRRITNVSATGFTVEQNGRVQTVTQWACDHGNLQWLSGGQGSSSAMAGNTTATIDSVSASGYRLPATLAAGQTWSQDLTANSTVSQKGATVGVGANVVKTTCAYIGAEKLTVPAGAFDTVKITCHIDDAADVTLHGTTQHFDTVVDTSEWYAAGVGLIKSDSVGAPEVTSHFELSVYNP